MRKYYTRPCNFYYGSYAKKLVKNNKALPLAGNTSIAFDKLEVIERKKNAIKKKRSRACQRVAAEKAEGRVEALAGQVEELLAEECYLGELLSMT